MSDQMADLWTESKQTLSEVVESWYHTVNKEMEEIFATAPASPNKDREAVASRPQMPKAQGERSTPNTRQAVEARREEGESADQDDQESEDSAEAQLQRWGVQDMPIDENLGIYDLGDNGSDEGDFDLSDIAHDRNGWLIQIPERIVEDMSGDDGVQQGKLQRRPAETWQ